MADRFIPVLVTVCAFCGHSYAAKPPVTAVAISPDGKRVVAGSQAGIDVLSWPDLKTLKTIPTKLDQVHDLEFSPDGKRLLAAGGTPGESGVVEVFSWPAAKPQARYEHDGDLVYAVAWRPDSSGWAEAGLDRLIRVSSGGGKTIRRMTIAGHSRGVKAVGVLPGGKALVSGGNDNSLRVWSLPLGKAVRASNNHTRPIHDLAVRPKQAGGLPMVVTVSQDRTIRLWQPTIGRMVRFVRLKKAVPLAVRWTPDGSRIVVACTDGRLRVIDPDTVEIVQETRGIPGWAYSLDVHPDGKSAVIGGASGTIKCVPLSPRP
ncbi:MAG: WD40 repeat domain-containing protein [Planctomycetaceae bacterium]